MSTKRWLIPAVFFLAAALLFLTTASVYAAPLKNWPVTVTQPDGAKVDLLASGDEFYNWLHDANGYTVIQNPATGYYVYADLVNGKLVPTEFVAGRVDPASKGLSPYLNILPEQKSEIRQAFLKQQPTRQIHNAPRTGTITNLVVFIRFSGESEFTSAPSTYTNMLNSSTAGYNSLYNYYREVSYNTLSINSSLFPTPGSTVVSYQDSHPRGYFQPYDATTNPNGYTGGDNGTMRRDREHALLRDAIGYINGLGQFPSGAVIDGDGDGNVDSITFVVNGSPTGWSSLLWPHQWSLYSIDVYINSKLVDVYSLHLSSSVYTGVLAHEMFHVLGAPDLYHYTDNGIMPVGTWDVMEWDQDPPQHMGCYMKFKYGGWIGSIPQITTSGSYTLSPAISSTNNCYKIASPNSASEFFVVEYRQQTGTFESSLPGTGLLVYRINPAATGNADGPPDEVYIYRPDGTTFADGSINLANFSSDVGRTAINDATNPSSFLSNGSAGGLNISNVGSAGATISFDVAAAVSTSGFDSQFTSDAAGWKAVKGKWVVTGGNLKTNGMVNGWNSVINVTAKYSALDYTVRMKRTGCSTCANSIIVRGVPTPLQSDTMWNKGYYFEYSNNRYFSVWKITRTSDTKIKGWTRYSGISSSWNMLRVVANGGSFTFYINGNKVWSGKNASFANGNVGITFYRSSSPGVLYVDSAYLSTQLPGVSLLDALETFVETGETMDNWTSPNMSVAP